MPMEATLKNALGKMKQTDYYISQDGSFIIYGISENFSVDTFVMIGLNSNSNEFQVQFLEEVKNENMSFRILEGK